MAVGGTEPQHLPWTLCGRLLKESSGKRSSVDGIPGWVFGVLMLDVYTVHTHGSDYPPRHSDHSHSGTELLLNRITRSAEIKGTCSDEYFRNACRISPQI
jgi:hypothetical protein